MLKYRATTLLGGGQQKPWQGAAKSHPAPSRFTGGFRSTSGCDPPRRRAAVQALAYIQREEVAKAMNHWRDLAARGHERALLISSSS